MPSEVESEEPKSVASELCFDISTHATSHEEHKSREGQKSLQSTENNIGLPILTKTSGIFRYADRIDYTLMFFGTFGAAANGILISLFSLFFGDLVSAKVIVCLTATVSCSCDDHKDTGG